MARKKYLAGQTEPDGSVLICTLEFHTQRRIGSHGLSVIVDACPVQILFPEKTPHSSNR